MGHIIHTDLPSHRTDPKAYFREYKRRWNSSRQFPCECGRGPKTSKMRGCKQCNDEQERYELHGAAREEATRRNNDHRTKFADWFNTYACGQGRMTERTA